MQINRIQSYGSSWVNNRTGVNNHKTQTSPNFGIKVKVPVDIPDNIKTLDALKEYLNVKNMLELLGPIAAALGISNAIKENKETASKVPIDITTPKQLIDYLNNNGKTSCAVATAIGTSNEIKNNKETAVSSEPQQVKTKKIIPPTPEQQKQFEAFFDDLKIKYEKDKATGLYIIDKFKIDNKNLLNKHGIDLDTLFKYVQEIKGDADFSDSQITSLGNLEKIGRDADIRWSKITDLGNLKNIGGDANFKYSLITSLGKLKEIGGNAYFRNSQITDLGKLEYIGGNAHFRNSKITSLKHLKRIDGCAWFNDSKLISLGALEYVGNGYVCDSAHIKYQIIIKKGLKNVQRSNCD